jgi:hypothetical protein
MLKANLDKLLTRTKNDYAMLSMGVCSYNQACKTSYTHDADARDFICGSHSKDGDKKPWEIATWVLAGVLALFLLVAFMRWRSA